MVATQLKHLGSDLERAFDTQWQSLGHDLPRPEPDYKFHPTRGWEFDRAWPGQRIAVELEGGAYGPEVRCQNCGSTVRAVRKDGTPGAAVHIGGAHNRFTRFLGDAEKYNAAAVAGWLVLRFVHEDVYAQPFQMVDTIRQALNRRTPASLIEPLSPREMQILYLIASGYEGRDISVRLGLEISTVKRHAGNICMKLHARNRAGAVARAIAWGVLDLSLVPWADEVDLMAAIGETA